jgi:hypothetical protein
VWLIHTECFKHQLGLLTRDRTLWHDSHPSKHHTLMLLCSVVHTCRKLCQTCCSLAAKWHCGKSIPVLKQGQMTGFNTLHWTWIQRMTFNFVYTWLDTVKLYYCPLWTTTSFQRKLNQLKCDWTTEAGLLYTALCGSNQHETRGLQVWTAACRAYYKETESRV